MTWSLRFRIRQYLRESLWVLPLVGGVAGAVFAPLDVRVEHLVSMPAGWQYSSSSASTLLATIVGAMAALTGFVVTVSVLVVQMATGTFSARYMRIWYRDGLLKLLLAVLVCSLTFSFALLRRVTATYVPDLGVTVASALVVVGLLLFLVFLDRFVHRLRPVAVAALVGRAGQAALSERDAASAGAANPESSPPPAGPPTLVIVERGGVVQAIDTMGLVRWAAQRHGAVVMKYAVGDFVPSGAVLFEVWGAPGDARSALLGKVALGAERTIEQDPAFAVRILVDIAIKALSPAVNDPTTAVQALDHLEELLGRIGKVDLTLHSECRDEAGIVRLLLPHRSWEDYLGLGVTEIREYGAGAVQVTRRLRAVLDELAESVREEHRPAVETELTRLDVSVARHFAESVDLDAAGLSDRQGIGGPGATISADEAF
jgi:uncharacterized membrane protein